MSTHDNNRVRRMSLKKLEPHPKQGEIYESLPLAELRALAESMRLDGQRQPVEIMPAKNKAGLPAGTVIDGHNRIAAATLLGWTHIDVVIRCDLLDADAAAVELAHINANLLRRQLHPLDKAAALKRAYEIEKSKDLMTYQQEAEAYARLCAAAGLSGRHGKRLMNILSTPRAIQRAVRDGHLSIVMADRISRLPTAVQEQIVDGIMLLSTGKQIQAVVTRHIAAPTGRHRGMGDAFASFMRAVNKGLADVDGREQPVSPRLLQMYKTALEAAHKYFGECLSRIQTP